LSSGTFDITNSSWTVGNNWTMNSNLTFTATGSTVAFNGTTAGQKITSAGKSFANVVINGSGGYWTLQDSMTVTSNMTITAGTLDTSGSNLGISVGGSWSNTGGAFTTNQSTVTFTATTAGQTIRSKGSPFKTVNIGSAGAGGYWTLIDSMTVSTATISSGNTLELAGQGLKIS